MWGENELWAQNFNQVTETIGWEKLKGGNPRDGEREIGGKSVGGEGSYLNNREGEDVLEKSSFPYGDHKWKFGLSKLVITAASGPLELRELPQLGVSLEREGGNGGGFPKTEVESITSFMVGVGEAEF